MSISRTYAVPRAAAEVARVLAEHPMADAVVDQVDGRRIRVGNQWLFDLASCNYLGLDLDPEVQAGVPAYLARWGTHPGWARRIASPACTPASRPPSASCSGSRTCSPSPP